MKDRNSRKEPIKNFTTGIPTGFDNFDRMTGGLKKSNLIVLAGRPSMGKTAMALDITLNIAIQHNIPVCFFSLEMSKAQLAKHLLCSTAKINQNRLNSGDISAENWKNISKGMEQLSEASIYIDDTPEITVLEMKTKVRRLSSQCSLGLIVVDYLQLIQSRGSIKNSAQQLSEITSSLKAMAEELNVPVLILSQLKRGRESRANKRPQMSDLQESSAIEQYADMVCFIYRDEVYHKTEDNLSRCTAELIVGKNRNGTTGTVLLNQLCPNHSQIPL